jgi:ABC-type glycerol-3-phosphate transport system substrate-binding protein
MLTPQSDTGGPGVQPYSARYIRMNHIGGASWNESGTWIEWEFTVPEDGLYKIAMNTRQNFQRGANAFRRITIDGVVPFSEMEAVGFPFQNGWRVSTLGDDEPYLFWFEAGTTHTIRMESILGAYAPYVREVQGAITRLNEIYRQIVMITGPNPDIFRDYHIGSRLPQLQAAIGQERDMLQAIFASLQEVSVGRGDRNTMIRTLYRLLESLYDDIENIPRRLNRFRENIGALGTWLMLVQEQQLAVDAIYILPADADTPDNGRRWWRQIWHEIVTLVLSFFINYDIIGDVVDGQLRHIEVWIGTGRDQATIIKRLIDDRFTPETGIGVTLRLVDIAMILPATVAGQGPDVTLSIFNSLPMDYGMRGAVRDISGFPYFEEVAARFPEAAMVPYTFRDYVFALPETITFPMLFYRRDILHDIGLTPPDTWDEVRSAIATLALHHMDFGIPMNEDMNGIPFPHFSYGIFLYQMGGEFFIEDGAASGLDSDIALNAFRDFTRFFTDYNLPRVYNFANRFRFGDMPLAIADYTMYNMLQVFAPEIRGLWGFRPVPGTVHPCEESETGYRIDRSVPAGGNAVVMMQQAADPYAAWDFMKWWTSAEIQTQFGREMESLMGSAARHPTANLEAFGQMPWPAQDYRMLSWQFEYIRGIPEVPGGYFNPRQVRNAFFTVVEMQTIAPRDGLVDAVRLINDELRAKRREFGID